MAFDGSLVLCRPTDVSTTASILANADLEIYLEHGTVAKAYTVQTAVQLATAGTPYEVLLGNLTADTQYYYRIRHRVPGNEAYEEGEENVFHTQRASQKDFTFTVTADPHFGDAAHHSAALYAVTAANVLADAPDFNVDLGDDFMIGGLVDPT